MSKDYQLMEERIIAVMESLKEGIERNTNFCEEYHLKGLPEMSKYHDGVSTGYTVAYKALQNVMEGSDGEE